MDGGEAVVNAKIEIYSGRTSEWSRLQIGGVCVLFYLASFIALLSAWSIQGMRICHYQNCNRITSEVDHPRRRHCWALDVVTFVEG